MSAPAPSATQGDSTLQAALWALPLALACAIPGLVWVWAERPMPPRLRLAVTMTIVVACIAATIFLLLRSRSRRLRWSLSVTTMIILAVFQWSTLTIMGRIVADSLGMPILREALPVLTASGFLWVAVRVGGDWQFGVLVGAALLTVVGVMIGGIIPRIANPPLTAHRSETAYSPDVVMVIVDGYTRSDVLLEMFGYDNSPFEDQLTERGFTVAAAATANYNVTHGAVSSMLDLDYLFTPGPIDSDEWAAMRNALSGDPSLFRLFRERGYDIAYAENYWAGSKCGPAVDLCWRDGHTEQALWNLSRMTVLAPLVERLRPHPFSTIAHSHLISLPDIVRSQRSDGVPRLTLAHLTLPHPPYLLDAGCRQQTGSLRNGWEVYDPDHVVPRQQYYVDQVACINDLLIDAIDEILGDRPDTLFMITSDHGIDTARVRGTSWTNEEYAERMSIMSAYRVPGCERQVPSTITPVNGARAVANCALEIALPALPDHAFWLSESWNADVRDIGALLDG